MNIIEAIRDKRLLGHFLGNDLSSWENWLTALRVLYGLPTIKSEKRLIRECTGRSRKLLPRDGFDTALFLCGRRSGKSRIASLIGAFEATLAERNALACGERSTVGDSENRQVEGASRYAETLGLPFDEQLADKAVSAFKGKNKRTGTALAGFLARVHAGEIPSGSILVVENTDRLSREDTLNAFDTISSIIRAGITIHTVSPEMDYNLASLNGGQIYFLIAQIQLAHEESAKKSKRIIAAREAARNNARENGRVLSGMVPAWLRVVGTKPDQKIEVIPEAV